MNKVIKQFGFGLALAAFMSAGAMAQTPAATPEDPVLAAEKADTYKKFTDCRKAMDVPGINACIAVGEAYLTKFGTPPDPYSEYVTKQLVTLKKRPMELELAAAYKKLGDSISAKSWKDAIDAAKRVIAADKTEPVKLDMTLLMATIGYDMAFAATPDNSLNAETLANAKSAIRMMESGVVSEPKPGANNTTLPATWGGLGVYAYKTKDNALAWMNFAIGRLIADTNKDTTRNLAVYKEAAPYFYKAVKYDSPDIKKSFIPYQRIGSYYREELNAKVDEYDTKKCKDLTEDAPDAAACKTIYGLQLAYAERGADAYARAYDVAKKDAAQTQQFKDGLLKSATAFYEIRFPKATGVNDFVAKAVTTPLPDPTGTPAPIAEEAVTTAVAPVTTTITPAKPATSAPAPTAKPATPPAKPATSGTKVSKATAKKKAAR